MHCVDAAWDNRCAVLSPRGEQLRTYLFRQRSECWTHLAAPWVRSFISAEGVGSPVSPHFYQADYGSFSLEKRECDHMVTGNLVQQPCRGPFNAMLCFPF